MPDVTTLNETLRSVDGSEYVRLATPGANWRATTGAINDAIDLKRGIVNVRAFGAVGNNNADDTTAIQAAIDYCYNNFTSGTRTIFLPGGLYKITLPIFVDRPNNLRGTNVTAPNWSSATTYAQNAIVTYNGIPWRSQLNSNTNNAPVLPRKGVVSAAHVAGEVVEARGLYWICILNYSGTSSPITDTTHWASYPIWWTPTTVTATSAIWAATLLGEEGMGSAQDNYGSVLMPVFNSTVCLWSCHGNGNMIKNIAIRGPTSSDGWGYRRGQPGGGVGIAIPGGGGGASRTLIENCEIYNFNGGISVGWNSDGLGDSNTFRKCNIGNAGFGITFATSQAFINSISDCNIQGNTAVYAPMGQGVYISGGNLSAVNCVGAGFTISGTSAFTVAHAGNAYQISFTTVITAPDTYLLAGVYNAFFVATTHFGIVRLDMTAFDPVTNIASMTINQRWYDNNYGNNDAITSASLLGSEIQAATKLYAVEAVTTLSGGGITAIGFHLENSFTPTTLINSAQSVGSSPTNAVRNVLYNFDPAAGLTNSDANLAKYYGAQLVGHIIANSAKTLIEGCEMGMGSDPVLVDVTQSCELTLRGNIRFTANTWEDIHVDFRDNTGVQCDRPLFGVPVIDGTNGSWQDDWGQCEHWGVRPGMNSRPVITSAQLATLTGTLPALFTSGSRTGYPLLFGRHPYTVCAFASGISGVTNGLAFLGGVLLPNYEIVSDHDWWSYGQDLTTTNIPNLAWSYQGQSTCVYANIELLNKVFPGLGIILNDGTTDNLYVVRNVFRDFGYFTVGTALSGTKTSVITGTVVKQQPYAIKRIGFVKKINYQTPTTGTTITLNNNDTHLILNPAGTLAALTVKMCSAPFDAQEIDIKSSQTITVLTVAPNTSQFAVGLPTTIGAGIVAKGIYRTADTTWYF